MPPFRPPPSRRWLRKATRIRLGRNALFYPRQLIRSCGENAVLQGPQVLSSGCPIETANNCHTSAGAPWNGRRASDADLADLFPGYESRWIETSGGRIFARVSNGGGPPLLLLHGHPQSNVSGTTRAYRAAGQSSCNNRSLQKPCFPKSRRGEQMGSRTTEPADNSYRFTVSPPRRFPLQCSPLRLNRA